MHILKPESWFKAPRPQHHIMSFWQKALGDPFKKRQRDGERKNWEYK